VEVVVAKVFLDNKTVKQVVAVVAAVAETRLLLHQEVQVLRAKGLRVVLENNPEPEVEAAVVQVP
jgi:hypothetical protein